MRKCIFHMFVWVDVGIDFGFQDHPKMDPKRSQDGPKRIPKASQKVFEKCMLFGRVKNSKKVTLENLGGPFCRNMVPKRGPQSIKKLLKIGFLSDSLLGGLRHPKKFPKMVPKCSKIFPNMLETVGFLKLFSNYLGFRFQDGPRFVQDARKQAWDEPREVEPKSAPSGARIGPRWRQDGTKSGQDGLR